MKISIAYLLSIIFWLVYPQYDYFEEVKQWQKELNDAFSDKEMSPLEKKDLRKFNGLDFYPIDSVYRVRAQFIRTPDALPFMMPTTTQRKPVYQKYGEAHFTLDSTEITLSLYQSLSLSETEEYEDYLFLPFTDETSGIETYGGGRYIDLRIPEGDFIIIDFNKAYNPSCAYNGRYSCPIPPRENDIPVEIKAGVLNWEKGH